MRRAFVVIHRWLGLGTALFLFVAGFTGAFLAWDHEIDSWLNPDLYFVSADQPLPLLQIADQYEREHPEQRVRYLPLAVEEGQAAWLWLQPAKAGQEPAYDQVAIDPGDGKVLGQRLWGAFRLDRRNLMPFLYKLHYSLHLPDVAGAELGVLLMGAVAIVWTLDAFIALWISFPSWRGWQKSFAFRFRAGGYRLLFDLHRSSGVWLWPLLLTLAVTAVSMNLGREVVLPIVRVFSPVATSPFELRRADPRAAVPVLSRTDILQRAQHEAAKHGIAQPPGGIAYVASLGMYGVGFYETGQERGEGLGNPWLYFDAHDGKLMAAQIPGQGSAGDLFVQAQFPLHSGRILGLWGRVLISALGLVTALLSVTGLVIWARKRRARVGARRKASRCLDSADDALATGALGESR